MTQGKLYDCFEKAGLGAEARVLSVRIPGEKKTKPGLGHYVAVFDSAIEPLLRKEVNGEHSFSIPPQLRAIAIDKIYILVNSMRINPEKMEALEQNVESTFGFGLENLKAYFDINRNEMESTKFKFSGG
jgi:hypothetical protein